MREVIYFGRRDKDLLAYMESCNVGKGDVSFFVRELMRDGIKFRNSVQPSNATQNMPTGEERPRPEPTPSDKQAVTLASKGARLEVKAKIGSNTYDNKDSLMRKLDNLI
jgi:hypothetical protein